ncbi:MAG: thiamine-phosphate kinase, partial [Vicinamibacteria bacterium]
WERWWKRDPTLTAVSSGEDYELLFTSGNEKKLDRFRERLDLFVTRIGETTEEENVDLVGRDGVVRPLPAKGWDHFGK